MEVKCLMCLENPTIPGCRFLYIFNEEGLALNISNIIQKYFWIKPCKSSAAPQQICLTCWEIVREFHLLYQRVELAHNHLKATILIDDPLPQDILLKSEGISRDPELNNSSVDNLFDSEVKVEVNDLDLLPQIEILETSPNVTPKPSTRRTKQIENATSKVSCKRIKKEDVPTENYQDFMNTSDELNNYSHSILDMQETDALDPNAKKRIRSRRSDNVKTKAANTRGKSKIEAEKIETLDIEAPTCSTNAAANLVCVAQIENPEIKEERQADEQIKSLFDNNDSDDGTDEMDSENDDGAGGDFDKDLEDSDDDESDGDDSDGSDWLDQEKPQKEKYAVIPKKERIVPKKYKKREKSEKTEKSDKPEVKRMSQEEIAARRAQQDEYDAIIVKFFENIRCPKCELLVKTYGDLRAHFRIDHNEDNGFVECCGRRFTTRKALAEHIMVHNNPEHFKCKTCDKICRDSTKLEIHEQTHLPNPPPNKYKKSFQCEKCSKTFASKASFEHHMVAKHVPREEFKFECPECHKKCPTDQFLRYHIKSVHDSLNTFICDKCAKPLKSSYSLKKHHELEHSELPKPIPIPQQCEICGAWLRHLAGLKQHMKNIHEGVQTEHKCHICNKVSSNSRALKRHMYHMHECARKFQCTMCDKAFKRPQDLREHTSVHTGEVLYTCPNCPMTFYSNANMYKHRQRLHRSEWEAEKQKTFPPNIMQQAKQGSKVIKVKSTAVDSSNSSNDQYIHIKSETQYADYVTEYTSAV